MTEVVRYGLVTKDGRPLYVESRSYGSEGTSYEFSLYGDTRYLADDPVTAYLAARALTPWYNADERFPQPCMHMAELEPRVVKVIIRDVEIQEVDLEYLQVLYWLPKKTMDYHCTDNRVAEWPGQVCILCAVADEHIPALVKEFEGRGRVLVHDQYNARRVLAVKVRPPEQKDSRYSVVLCCTTGQSVSSYFDADGRLQS